MRDLIIGGQSLYQSHHRPGIAIAGARATPSLAGATLSSARETLSRARATLSRAGATLSRVEATVNC